MTESAMSMATVMGGTEIAVQMKDRSSAVVWVRQLEIEDYPELLKRMDDERAQIELYCRIPAPAGVSQTPEWEPVPPGWSKKLSVEGHDLVMTTAEEINRDFFARWLQRRFAKLEAVRPGLTEKLLDSLGAAGATAAGLAGRSAVPGRSGLPGNSPTSSPR